MVKIDCIFFLFSISFEKKKQGNLMVVKLSFCIFVYFGWFLILRKTLNSVALAQLISPTVEI